MPGDVSFVVLRLRPDGVRSRAESGVRLPVLPKYGEEVSSSSILTDFDLGVICRGLLRTGDGVAEDRLGEFINWRDAVLVLIF